MAQLIAVVFPEGEADAAVHDVARRNGLTALDPNFAEQLCGALRANGTLAFFVAEDGAAPREALQHGGAIVLQTQLGEQAALEMAAGATHNPQVRGQKRRESGGESTEESGQ
jgi:hypothetical protein